MKQLIALVSIIFFTACKGQIETKPVVITTFEYLSDQELKTKSKDELQLLRNEVFAHKGYVFKKEELNKYFNTKSWYKPNSDLNIKLSQKEEEYVSRIKEIESKFALNGNKNCLYNFGLNNSDFFPLTSNILLDENYKYSISLEKIKIKNLNEVIKENLCGGGGVWDIMCYENIKYQLLFYTCDSHNIYMKMAIIKEGEVKEFKELYGSSMGYNGDSLVDGYHDVDFKLDRNDLEVYKTYYIFDPEGDSPFAKKEVRKEFTKYKLTDQGLVKL
ncbi:YARHG domain-containing protein [Aquimarina muelleri]|uniref:YARHG domain-containing protein n=1 Tax=Aquimarina muelleri TaxID=279356 RepID=UPI003F6821CA